MSPAQWNTTNLGIQQGVVTCKWAEEHLVAPYQVFRATSCHGQKQMGKKQTNYKIQTTFLLFK